MKKQLGDRIATLQREKGYTRKELASMVGFTAAAMSRSISRLRVIASSTWA